MTTAIARPAGSHRWLLMIMGVAALLPLGACERHATPQLSTTTLPDANANPVEVATVATDPSSQSMAVANAMPYGASAPMAPGTDLGSDPGNLAETSPTSAGLPSAAAIGAPEIQFITETAASGLFEVKAAQLAAEKASDSAVKSYATMLVEDHSAANEKLRQLASGLNVTLPNDLSDADKKLLDRLSRASGVDFDRQFVEAVGIKDHKDHIASFEKVGNATSNAAVRGFALATLPTLRAHLSAAQRLPVKG